MRPRRKVVLSTTPSLEGWEITDYLGPVSAQFVIGTGFFADLISTFTDFFGAHSQSYQKKLDKLDEEALALIEFKALRMAANAVVGLRVDHDEISGSGKSMLMVTASGTAVRAQRLSRAAAPAEPRTTVTAADLNAILERAQLMRLAEAGQLPWQDEETWRFIVDTPMDELAADVLERVSHVLHSGDEDVPAARAKYAEYFLSLPQDLAKSYLYSCAGRDDQLWDFALRVIRDGHLFDPQSIMRMLSGQDQLARRRTIQAVIADAPAYTASDLSALSDLASAIRATFVKREVRVAKGILGEKQVWICECDSEVRASEERCARCGRDAWGFYQELMHPDRAAALIDRRIQALEQVFKRGAPVDGL